MTSGILKNSLYIYTFLYTNRSRCYQYALLHSQTLFTYYWFYNYVIFVCSWRKTIINLHWQTVIITESSNSYLQMVSNDALIKICEFVDFNSNVYTKSVTINKMPPSSMKYLFVRFQFVYCNHLCYLLNSPL